LGNLHSTPPEEPVVNGDDQHRLLPLLAFSKRAVEENPIMLTPLTRGVVVFAVGE
jgi:hypothetical protein